MIVPEVQIGAVSPKPGRLSENAFQLSPPVLRQLGDERLQTRGHVLFIFVSLSGDTLSRVHIL